MGDVVAIHDVLNTFVSNGAFQELALIEHVTHVIPIPTSRIQRRLFELESAFPCAGFGAGRIFRQRKLSLVAIPIAD